MAKINFLLFIGAIIQFVGIIFGVVLFNQVWNSPRTFYQLLEYFGEINDSIIFPLLIMVGLIFCSVGMITTKHSFLTLIAIINLLLSIFYTIIWTEMIYFTKIFQIYSVFLFAVDLLLIIGAIFIRKSSKLPIVFFSIAAGFGVAVNLIFGVIAFSKISNPILYIQINRSVQPYLEMYLWLLTIYLVTRAIAYLQLSFVEIRTNLKVKIKEDSKLNQKSQTEDDFIDFEEELVPKQEKSTSKSKKGKNSKNTDDFIDF
jgi:hypothetical protein